MNGIAGLLLVALVWGITNPFIKRGSAGLNTLRQNREYNRASGMSRVFKDLAFLARTPQYWIPLAVNLLGSVYFIIALANAKLSMVSPITNSLTLAITAVAGTALGEPLPSLRQALGIALILAGVAICGIS